MVAASVKLVSSEIGSRFWEGTIGSRNYWRSRVCPQAFHLESSLKRRIVPGCLVGNNTYWIIYGWDVTWGKRCLGILMLTHKWLVYLLGLSVETFATYCKDLDRVKWYMLRDPTLWFPATFFMIRKLRILVLCRKYIKIPALPAPHTAQTKAVCRKHLPSKDLCSLVSVISKTFC